MFRYDQLLVEDERQRHETGAAIPKRRRVTRIAKESLCRLQDNLEKKSD